jgi:hypothetical protein
MTMNNDFSFFRQSRDGTKTDLTGERALHDIAVHAMNLTPKLNLGPPELTSLFMRILPHTAKSAPLRERLVEAEVIITRAKSLWMDAHGIYSGGSALKAIPANSSVLFVDAALDLMGY